MYLLARDEIEGARSAVANDVFSMTITKRCWGAAGAAVGRTTFAVGTDDAGAVRGVVEADGGDEEIALGAEHAAANATTTAAFRATRITQPLFHHPGRKRPRESSGFEYDLVPGRRAPRSTAPSLGRKGSSPTTPDTAADQNLEVSERHASTLLVPDRAEREDRVESGVCIHGYMKLLGLTAQHSRRNAGSAVSDTFRSTRAPNAGRVPGKLRRR